MRIAAIVALFLAGASQVARAQADEPRLNPFACLGEGDSLARAMSVAEMKAEVEKRIAHPPAAEEGAPFVARHHCVTAELMRRVGDTRAAAYYDKAVAADPKEPGLELWYGYYLRNVRGPRAPLVEKAEARYYAGTDKLRAVRSAGAEQPFDDITESWMRRGLMSLYQEDGLPLLRSKAFPYNKNGANRIGLALTVMLQSSVDTNEFGTIDDTRRFSAEAAFAGSPQRLNRELDDEELRAIIRAPIRYNVYSRLRLRLPVVGAIDASYRHFRAPDSQIEAFTEPNNFTNVAVDEIGVGWKRAFDLYPLFDFLADVGYRRVERRGVVEWYPDLSESINLLELRPAVSRFLGPDKLTVGMNYVFMDIPPVPGGALVDRVRARAIRAYYFDYAFYRPLLLPDVDTGSLERTLTRGFHVYGGYALDDEAFGVRVAHRSDAYLGTSLRGVGGFDLTVQGTLLRSDTTEERRSNGAVETVLDGAQTVRHVRPTVVGLYRLVDDEAIPDVPKTPLAGLNLVVPLRADFALEGPQAYENLRGGVELWGKFISTGLRGTHFLVTAGYEAQWFHRINRILHMGRVEMRMGWSGL